MSSCKSSAQCNHIGEIQDGSYVITCNQTKLKSCLQEILAIQNIEVTLTNLEIKSAVDSASNTYYYLLAKDAEQTVKMATSLRLEENIFYLRLSSGNATTCTCDGCSDSCDPYQNEHGTWRCLDFCHPESCTKSVTVSSKLVKCLNDVD